MEINESFLGTGWSFPPRFNKVAKSVEMSSDEQDIQESLKVLLSTRPGERIMLPRFGCSLEELLFESLTLSVKTSVANLIRNAILYYEPRIDLIHISFENSDDYQGRVDIHLEYRIRSTNSRMNMVYPFYRIEGNDVPLAKTGDL